MTRVDRLLQVLGYLLAACVVAILLCIIAGEGRIRDMRPRLEVRNGSAFELRNLHVSYQSTYPNVVWLPPVAPHSGLIRRVEPARKDIIQVAVVGPHGRIVSEPLYASYDWDYDMRVVVDSVGAMHLSQVPRAGADAHVEGSWARLIVIASGVIVWLVAPAFVALWGWQLQQRRGSPRKRALAFLMSPVVALVAALGAVYWMALTVRLQVPPPINRRPVEVLMIIGGLWVLIVASVNAACLGGERTMPSDTDGDTRRGWRIVFVLAHVAFMIMNVLALVSTVGQRTVVEPIYWRVSSEAIEGIVFMDTWGTFGRLGLLAAGIYLAALMARGDKRVPRYYVWYGVACLVFEAVLNRAQLQQWGVPRGTTRAWYASHVLAYAAAMVGWVVYVSRSKKVRATFVSEPQVMAPMDRLLIGLVALALIAWPFVLNAFVDVTGQLAGRISPKDATAGTGFADGIMATSAATGLFVLMKNVWHMSRVWIAVLLPACFTQLVLLYGAQCFMLHWRF